jgi:hypothetical protein
LPGPARTHFKVTASDSLLPVLVELHPVSPNIEITKAISVKNPTFLK